MTTVNSLVSSSKPGSQKFLEASDQVQSYLADHGVHIDMKTVQSVVQAAYEKSPLTGNNQSTSTVTVGPEGVTTTIKPADGTAKAIDPKEVA